MYFLFFLHFLIPYFPSFLYFPFLSRTSLQNPVEHARFRSLLQHTSFPLPFPPVLPCIGGFYLDLRILPVFTCNAFVFPFFFTRIFLKNFFIFDDLFFYGFGSCLSNTVVFSLDLMHQQAASVCILY